MGSYEDLSWKTTLVNLPWYTMRLEKKFCDCCSQRYWGFKRSNLSIEKVDCVIATWDGPKSWALAHLRRPRKKTDKLLKLEVTSYPCLTAVEL